MATMERVDAASATDNDDNNAAEILNTNLSVHHKEIETQVKYCASTVFANKLFQYRFVPPCLLQMHNV